jgi:hypothetical protein
MLVEAGGVEPPSKIASAVVSTSMSRGLNLAAVRPAGGLAVASPTKRFHPRIVGTPMPGLSCLRRPTRYRRLCPGDVAAVKQPEPIQNRRLVFSNSLTRCWSSTRTRAYINPVETLSPPCSSWSTRAPHARTGRSLLPTYCYNATCPTKLLLYVIVSFILSRPCFDTVRHVQSRDQRLCGRSLDVCRTGAYRVPTPAPPWPSRP